MQQTDQKHTSFSGISFENPNLRSRHVESFVVDFFQPSMECSEFRRIIGNHQLAFQKLICKRRTAMIFDLM